MLRRFVAVCIAMCVAVPNAAAGQPAPGRSRDSVRNGAFLGTVIGAAAAATLAALICRAYQEEGAASCAPDTLRFAAVGGAIGAGTGVVIDVARQRRVTVRFVVRF